MLDEVVVHEPPGPRVAPPPAEWPDGASCQHRPGHGHHHGMAGEAIGSREGKRAVAHNTVRRQRRLLGETSAQLSASRVRLSGNLFGLASVLSDKRHTHSRRISMRLLITVIGAVAALGAVLAFTNSGAAEACAGLIGSNGAVNLGRTTTLAGYHDGVEHYVTAFKFLGGGGQFGTLIPLPGVPTSVERGGAWTLQRLVR